MANFVKSGTIVIIWLAVSGFIVMNLYKTDLLSFLTVKKYEKPIETIKDLLESDLIKYHFYDESFFLMKDHPRKEYRQLYKQVSNNGWIVTSLVVQWIWDFLSFHH